MSTCCIPKYDAEDISLDNVLHTKCQNDNGCATVTLSWSESLFCIFIVNFYDESLLLWSLACTPCTIRLYVFTAKDSALMDGVEVYCKVSQLDITKVAVSSLSTD